MKIFVSQRIMAIFEKIFIVEKQNLERGIVYTISEDTTITTPQTYPADSTVIVKNNAQVVWALGVNFLADCKLIVESGR